MDTRDMRQAITQFAAQQGLRMDWHEPDEQGVDAKVIGRSFDNACCLASTPEAAQQGWLDRATEPDLHLLLRVDKQPTLAINLALLLADYAALVAAAK